MLASSVLKLNPRLPSYGRKVLSCYNIAKTAQCHSKIFSSLCTQSCAHKNFSTQSPRSRASESVDSLPMSFRLGRIAGALRVHLTRYVVQGVAVKNLYECCAHGVEYIDFFKTCDMPDTFQSWFYVLQLHMWMVLVRLKSEGKHGKRLSYHLVELMWTDLQERIKLLGVEDTSQKKESMEEYSQQFFGLIVAYDEGLLGEDKILASALWRNMFYAKENMDPEKLALMVCYVRRQTQYLEQQDTAQLLLTGKVKWLPLQDDDKS